MLKQLGPYRVHLIFAGLSLAWFSFATILGVLDGDSVFHAFSTSIREVKLVEWVSAICMWIAVASLIKQNDELRAKIQLLESRQ